MIGRCKRFVALLRGLFFLRRTIVTATVEAVGTNLALGQSDTLNQRFNLVEFQCREFQSADYLVHHALVFGAVGRSRSEEHTSELQSRQYLVCRLLLEKKKKTTQ